MGWIVLYSRYIMYKTFTVLVPSSTKKEASTIISICKCFQPFFKYTRTIVAYVSSVSLSAVLKPVCLCHIFLSFSSSDVLATVRYGASLSQSISFLFAGVGVGSSSNSIRKKKNSSHFGWQEDILRGKSNGFWLG